MIICPSCKEEIENNSRYCDQCGQALLYCCSCGHVGTGRHCTYCGGQMQEAQDSVVAEDIPSLTLSNDVFNMRLMGINGAVIGRKQGPYKQMFEQNRYVSGLHAQLVYDEAAGWCIVDMNSSNGTKLNNKLLTPGTKSPVKTGDIVTVANVNLMVNVK